MACDGAGRDLPPQRWRGAAIFVGTVLGGVSLMAAPPIAAALNDGLTRALAEVTAPLLGLVGMGVDVAGSTLRTDRLTVEIIAACTPVYPALFYAAAVLAVPSRPRRTIVGVAVGWGALWAVNQVRILSLIAIGHYAPELFDVAHYWIWQALIVLVALVAWLVWWNGADAE